MDKVTIKNTDPKILLIMLGRIGDILLTTPVAKELKRLLDNPKIYFLVEKQFLELLTLNPFIDEIIILEKKIKSELKLFKRLRDEKFDILFDFHSNPRTSFITLVSSAKKSYGYNYNLRHLVYDNSYTPDGKEKYAVEFKFNLLRLAGLNPQDIKTCFFFSREDEMTVDKILSDLFLTPARFIVLSTTSRKQANRWIPEYFAKLAKGIFLKTSLWPVFIYGPGEQEYVNKIYNQCSDVSKILPPLTIKQAGAVLSKAMVVVGVDNGLKHLAVAVGTPTFTIFGPSQPEYWTPPDKMHMWVRAEVDCIECYRRRCANMRCMKELDPDMVLNNLLNFLEKINKI